MTMNYADRDNELYQQWKKNPNKQNMSKLIKQLMPVINREVNRQTGSLPTSVLRGTGIEWAIKAVENFDDTKGAKLSTHVANYVQKIRRENYKYQNAAKLPENLQLEFGNFRTAVEDLSSELDRDPTDSELASRLGWKTHNVKSYRNRLFEDVHESGSVMNTATTAFNTNTVLLQLVRDSLDPQELIVYENQIKDKKDQLSNTALASKMGINQNRLQYIKRKVIEKAKNIKNDMGSW